MGSTTMEMHRGDHDEAAADNNFNLREWALMKAKMVSRENTNSRRFSASSITRRSFREDPNKSFRSNITISSTASSPGYNTIREEIDPSTYSFTAALKALQARSAYSWECISPDGFALNSKWNEAEKYICNPLSGEVPLECLSAKTLVSGRSFRHLAAGRITMSAPLIYPSRLVNSKSSLTTPTHDQNDPHFPIQEKKVGSGRTRDVGTQSTPPDLSSSSSPSPAPTPSIEDMRSIKRDIEAEIDESPPTTNLEKPIKFGGNKVEMKETREKEETKEQKTAKQTCRCMCKCSSIKQLLGGGCLSWRALRWMRKRQKREKQKQPRPKKKNNNIFIHHINGMLH